MKRPAFLPAIVVAALAYTSAGYAQSGPMPVTVLAFSDNGGSEGLAEAMYGALRTQVEFHREYRLNDVPAQPLDDLLLAVGCSELSEDCGDLVAELMGTRFLAWGDVADVGSEVHVTMVLWDLELAREVRTRVHALPEADAGLLTEHHQVVGRSLLYGDEGTLTVDALPEGARVTVDGRDVGNSPVTLDSLPFGFYRVEVESEAHEPFQTWAVVDLGGSRVTPTLGELVASRDRDRAPAVSEGPTDRTPVSAAPAQWTLIGVGGAAAAAGLVFAIQKGQTQQEFDRVVTEQVLNRDRAEDLRAEGERQARLSNVFVATGLALVATGVIWRVVSPPDDSEENAFRMGAWASRDGAGLSLRLAR